MCLQHGGHQMYATGKKGEFLQGNACWPKCQYSIWQQAQDLRPRLVHRRLSRVILMKPPTKGPTTKANLLPVKSDRNPHMITHAALISFEPVGITFRSTTEKFSDLSQMLK